MAVRNTFERMEQFTDSQLARLAGGGNSDAFMELAVRYLPLIRARAERFRGAMLETDDLCQEGLMGLLNAARTYDSAGEASFRTYAGVCVGNRMIMACRAAGSRKNLPMHDFISLSDGGAEVQDSTSNPENVLIDSEAVQMMRQRMKQALSPLEQKVLMLFLDGCSYRRIAERLRITSKAADNALQRVRLKLKKIYH